MQMIRKDKLRKHKKIKFHVFSEGYRQSFTEISGPDVELHLHEKFYSAFYALANADIIVTSKSSFSYSAALLNNGTVYYHQMVHPPLPHWHVVDESCDNEEIS